MYKYMNEIIPHDQRKSINDKIIYLIDSGSSESSGITREDIFNAYTGDGGLHGLKFSDYSNYYEYSSDKKEIENGQFFTPPPVCKFIIDCLGINPTETVADLTCGMGNFFNYCPDETSVYGCELDIKAYKVATYLYPKTNIECCDIRFYNPGIKFDFIVGNPPFNLDWWVDNAKVTSQMYYCKKAAELLKPMGIMAIIVPVSFLADDFMDKNYIAQMEEDFSFIGQYSIDKDTFANLGVIGYPTKIMFWQRNSSAENWKPKPYNLDIIPLLYLSEKAIDQVKSNGLADAQEYFRSHRSHILLELARDKDSSAEFLYKVKKYLYDIKRHPICKDKYNKCCEILNKFYHQQKPNDMKYEDWAKVRLTEAKVLAYLRGVLKKQNQKPYEDKIRLVKHDYSFGVKAYSPKMQRQLTESMKQETPVYKVVQQDGILPEYSNYSKMLHRRKREYKIEQQKFSEMTLDSSISEYLEQFTVFDPERDEQIYLNDIQKCDINKVLQKKYALLQWGQGSGKTLAGIAVSSYRMNHQNAFCTWVVSNAISIKNNWNIVLQDYRLPHIMITKLSDLDNIKRGDFVIITLNKIVQYRKQIKKWIKLHNQNVALCFDESDEISNPSSKRAKAMLDIFRRAKYKLLMTGTSTRNNISEFAPQLELLYNNSVNMTSCVEYIYNYSKRDKGEDGKPMLAQEENPYYGCPIPAYREGYRLFSSSHLPEKVTVFGIGQKTQDIYNADELSDILDRTVITRTFEEVSGKDIVNIEQVPVDFTPTERAVYQKAIERFEEMRGAYFASTGNSRKDAMMKLIQQITLLLRISAAPNTVREYVGGTPAKIEKVLDMLSEMDDQIVAIGVRHKEVVKKYKVAIESRFPHRSLFVVTGDTTTLAKRRALRKTLRESKNGILLCTQQSLPSSVNFEYVNKVIIPELHYNNSQMSQFYFRFIRYTSQNAKDVYFVTYNDSLEVNQMGMVLAKEKLNWFMRGDDVDLDEIYDRFGVTHEYMHAMLTREEDDEGHFRIRWGEQSVS